MEGPALSCTPTHSERKQEAACMSVNPRQEVPGRWLLFNAAIIVTIVWIDNHAHYREMGEEGSWELLGFSFEATVCSVEVWRTGWREGTWSSRGMCCRLGAWESLFVQSLHLIWVSQSNYLGWCFQGEERLTRARGQDRTALRLTRKKTVYSLT